jgi:hypothetical protein
MLKESKILCSTLVVFAFWLSAHDCTGQITDDFSDGDFTNNPGWSGDASKFVVQSNQLRLMAPAVNDVAYLSTPSTAINNASWEFFVQLDFDPSGSNYADVYLTSDNGALTESLTGYFVRIGNATDEVSLYRQDGNTKTKIIDGPDGRVSSASVMVKVKATRDEAGNWQLFSDPTLSGTFLLEGSILDATHLSSAFFGVVCIYTSTRSDDFYFDDVVVTGDPFVDPSTPGEYKDVIITEIFADPTPTVGLPDAEFVELHNRSSKIINLSGWKFTDGSSTAILPSHFLDPNDYLILTSTTSTILYSVYGTVMGVSNFPTLNNAGDNLILKRSDDVIIDNVNYTEDWYRDEDKSQGGYSLELIDPANPCGEEENWIASESANGGTPGTQNSVFANKPDLTGPKLISAIPISTTEVVLKFNEKLDDQLPVSNDFTITPTHPIVQVSFSDISLRSITLELNESLQSGLTYSITTQNIWDCNGNLVQPEFNSSVFGLPEAASPQDIVINEILFNPRPTGADFVEVFNNSSKFINIKNWSIANIENEVVTNPKIITTEDLLLPPGAYMAFTESSNIIKGEYISSVEENLFQVADLPSFNDDEGTVAVVDDQSNIIDFFSYTDHYHSVFLQDDEGVSLERISFDELTNNPGNWKSANGSAGYATPGYLNSNVGSEQPSGKVIVTPEVFEPITGQPDFTQIQYSFDQGGLVANVKILDFRGREIRQLANNTTLATSGFFRWDGDTQDGTKARVGYYVVWMEVFSASGKVETFRKRVVIASKH